MSRTSSMTNDKFTFHLNNYLRSSNPTDSKLLINSIECIVAHNFDSNTIAKLQKVLKDKDSLYVTLSNKVARTRSQESYYRKWNREFAEFCGMTPDEMHNEMLFQTFGTIEVETKFGWRKRPNKRSSNTTKQEFSSLIETLIRTAAEMGFNIPPPQRESNGEETKDTSRV